MEALLSIQIRKACCFKVLEKAGACLSEEACNYLILYSVFVAQLQIEKNNPIFFYLYIISTELRK